MSGILRWLFEGPLAVSVPADADIDTYTYITNEMIPVAGHKNTGPPYMSPRQVSYRQYREVSDEIDNDDAIGRASHCARPWTCACTTQVPISTISRAVCRPPICEMLACT
jgi:hypothetical protein